jgi:gluconolactonase
MKMYITDTGAVQAHATPYHGLNFSFNPKLPASIYSYDVVDSERLGNRQMLAFCDAGVPDGIKCDISGNVYSGCGDGIQCWDPKGTLIGKIYTGSTVGNFNFSKDGIWAFAEERLFLVNFGAKGALVQIECE